MTYFSIKGQLVIEIAKLRDACILLAGHRCYREYPLVRIIIINNHLNCHGINTSMKDWTLRQLTRAGFKIENVSNFETIQSADFVEVQLNVAESKVEFIKDKLVAEAMTGRIIIILFFFFLVFCYFNKKGNTSLDIVCTIILGSVFSYHLFF